MSNYAESIKFTRNVTVGDTQMKLPYKKGDFWILGDQICECINSNDKEINYNDWINVSRDILVSQN